MERMTSPLNGINKRETTEDIVSNCRFPACNVAIVIVGRFSVNWTFVFQLYMPQIGHLLSFCFHNAHSHTAANPGLSKGVAMPTLKLNFWESSVK